MFRFTNQRPVGFIAVCFSLLGSTTSCADSGVPSHGLQAESQEPSPIVLTLFTDEAELFLEYPRLLPRVEARFLAHLTVLSSGAPVRSGQLRLEIQSEAGETLLFSAMEPKRDGLFIPVGALPAAGIYTAKLTLVSDQLNASFDLPPLTVFQDLASAMQSSSAEEPVVADAVPFYLEQQWKIGLLMEKVERRSLTERLLLHGEMEAAQGSMAVVSAPLGGLLLPVDGKALPRVGDMVVKGQVLAYLDPPLSTSDVVQLSTNQMSQSSLAMEVLVRELDLQTKSLEVEQSLLQSAARLAFAEKAMRRIQGLRGQGLGTEPELEAASRDLELARQEAKGAERLKESLAVAEQSLRTMREQVDLATHASASPNRLRVAVVAPIDGEVIAVHHIAGEHVENQGAIYKLLDSSQVWLKAHISEFELAGLSESPGALLELEAFPGQSFDVLGAMGGKMVSVGRVIDPLARTLDLRYELPNPDGLFRVGMFADVFLETQSSKQTIAVPQQSVVIENGLPVAFVLLDGETFQKRELQLGIRDGDFIEVLSGIEEGDRVVTQGAFLVRLAMASPASFGEGHAH